MQGADLNLEVPSHHLASRSQMLRKLARGFLRWRGWTLEGEIPQARRFIVVAGPHTSNWDFVYGLSAAIAINLDIHWLGKHTLFKAPLGRFMYWLGGIPVDRNNPVGVARSVADRMLAADSMALIVTPEGTRGRVARWKTGFLRIAAMAQAELVVTTIDFASRTIRLGTVFNPGEDHAADIARIQAEFARVSPRNPANYR